MNTIGTHCRALKSLDLKTHREQYDFHVKLIASYGGLLLQARLNKFTSENTTFIALRCPKLECTIATNSTTKLRTLGALDVNVALTKLVRSPTSLLFKLKSCTSLRSLTIAGFREADSDDVMLRAVWVLTRQLCSLRHLCIEDGRHLGVAEPSLLGASTGSLRKLELVQELTLGDSGIVAGLEVLVGRNPHVTHVKILLDEDEFFMQNYNAYLRMRETERCACEVVRVFGACQHLSELAIDARCMLRKDCFYFESIGDAVFNAFRRRRVHVNVLRNDYMPTSVRHCFAVARTPAGAVEQYMGDTQEEMSDSDESMQNVDSGSVRDSSDAG